MKTFALILGLIFWAGIVTAESCNTEKACLARFADTMLARTGPQKLDMAEASLTKACAVGEDGRSCGLLADYAENGLFPGRLPNVRETRLRGCALGHDGACRALARSEILLSATIVRDADLLAVLEKNCLKGTSTVCTSMIPAATSEDFERYHAQCLNGALPYCVPAGDYALFHLRDRKRAADLLHMACAGGVGAGCFGLADMVVVPDHIPGSILDRLVQSCVLEHLIGCTNVLNVLPVAENLALLEKTCAASGDPSICKAVAMTTEPENRQAIMELALEDCLWGNSLSCGFAAEPFWNAPSDQDFRRGIEDVDAHIEALKILAGRL